MGCHRGLRVLIVDDDPLVRDVLAQRLAGWGHEALLASNAQAALRLASRQRPDVVISDVVLASDVVLSADSGYDLLRKLKARDSLRPVVLITAHGGPAQSVDAFREGADEFLVKPVDADDLRSLLDVLHVRLHEHAHVHRSLQDDP